MSVRLSGDPADIDLDVVHGYLTRSYWSPGISRELVARAAANSLCVSALDETGQIGFARVITDRATFAWLADVFVLERARGLGIGRAMVRWLMEHPELQNLRRWMLATWDAHGVYEALGWKPVDRPDRLLQRHDPEAHRR
ncbi:GNAT family N-acetyltransferase [Sphingomonas quercus]|uniref:GNAT family N-acetyltransferase n=1 Tax=Sphingomonas quercus TaxID=2842451 RepID=A0ABS6BFF0_9SPHN|nr:GNAT family N-acetyltransferase [Sphingomonas quercus]